MKNAVKKVIDNLPRLIPRVESLTKKNLLVGVPQDETQRKEGEMTNATLAYIHDNGSPAANIPARPFMQPGIKSVKPKLKLIYKKIALGILHGEEEALDKGYERAGLIAQAAIRAAINEGIPPPLKDSTLRNRIRKGTAIKGAKLELEARGDGSSAGMEFAKPLVATAQMRNSINYVIRKK